jgi:hypothetical protein
MIPPPPGTSIGLAWKLRPRQVTERPIMTPLAAPKTTSLASCWLSWRRDMAT